MKKTLIALTLAALPVAASADVILYGQIKGGVEVTKEKNVKGTTTNIADYGSRIGFKGREQLNGSLNAIWQLEQRVDIGGGANTRGFGTRDSFIGLQGDSLGTVKVGYQQTPTAALNDKLDIWEYSSDLAGLGTFTRSNATNRRATAVSYETPNWGGFSAKAYVSPSNNNNPEPVINANGERSRRNGDASIYGLSASYAQEKGFFADVAGTYVKNAYTVTNLNTGAVKNKDAYQALVQGGFDNDTWFGGLGYQYTKGADDIDAGFGTGSIERLHEVVGSVAYTFNDAVRLKGSAAYGFNAKDVNGNKTWGNGKYYQGVLGADYLLSKRTTANAQIGYLTAGKGDSKYRGGTVGVGMRHKF